MNQPIKASGAGSAKSGSQKTGRRQRIVAIALLAILVMGAFGLWLTYPQQRYFYGTVIQNAENWRIESPAPRELVNLDSLYTGERLAKKVASAGPLFIRRSDDMPDKIEAAQTLKVVSSTRSLADVWLTPSFRPWTAPITQGSTAELVDSPLRLAGDSLEIAPAFVWMQTDAYHLEFQRLRLEDGTPITPPEKFTLSYEFEKGSAAPLPAPGLQPGIYRLLAWDSLSDPNSPQKASECLVVVARDPDYMKINAGFLARAERLESFATDNHDLQAASKRVMRRLALIDVAREHWKQ